MGSGWAAGGAAGDCGSRGPAAWPQLPRLLLCVVVAFALGGSLAARAQGSAPSGEGFASEEGPVPAGSGTEPAQREGRSGLAYRVELNAPKADHLAELIEKSSQLLTLRDRPPSTLPGLVRRIESDVERFRTVLRSEGYYGGKVDYRLDRETTPITVMLTVTPGPPYLLHSYEIRFTGDDMGSPPRTPSLAEIGIRLGKRARAAAVVTAERRLLRLLHDAARPLARALERKVVVDHRTRTMDVTVRIDPGPAARFGPVTITGLTRTKEDYVRQWLTWSEGDPYNQRRVDAFRKDLLGTGLFSSVVVDRPERLDAQGELPLIVRVAEAKQRSIGFGVSYSTDRELGGKVFWKHRNLFGRDENLELSATADFLQQTLMADFERPNYQERDRKLFARAELSRNDTAAFNGFTGNGVLGLEWPLAEHWTASLGGTANYSNLDDAAGRQSSWLIGGPGVLKYDTTDSVLDPRRGARLDLATTPYYGQSGKGLLFNVALAAGSAYYPLDAKKHFVLAGRLRLGSIVGEDTPDVPADKRFYAGGGSSIRGYEFQKVGPLDDTGQPIGGRSLFEVSVELRARVWKDIGVVSFIDGGNVFEQVYPDFSRPIRWAAGLGLRYHTSAGPIRLDVAFPINRRKGIDDRLQFYISFGQAF